MDEGERSPRQARLWWDFFGPRAEGTARHFESHLAEFLERERIEDCQLGTESPQPNHWAVWCRCPAAREAALVTALRPRRRDSGEGP